MHEVFLKNKNSSLKKFKTKLFIERANQRFVYINKLSIQVKKTKSEGNNNYEITNIISGR